ncbi:MAG: hypothetical protein AAGA69_07290, partial [Pseudomonadota bacterium]
KLRDRLSDRYRQEGVGGEPSGVLGFAPASDKIVVTGSRVLSEPQDIFVTISIYAKFALR